jgi:hypothetical protein
MGVMSVPEGEVGGILVEGIGRLLPQAESKEQAINNKERIRRYDFMEFLIKLGKRFHDRRSSARAL